jgi:hypothetical protein
MRWTCYRWSCYAMVALCLGLVVIESILPGPATTQHERIDNCRAGRAFSGPGFPIPPAGELTGAQKRATLDPVRIIRDLQAASEGPITAWGWAGIVALFATEALTVLAVLLKAWEILWLLWQGVQHISGIGA